MLTVNQQHLERREKYSIFTIPKNMNYSGFKAVIPNKFISKDGFCRYINLPDEQRLKIKKDDKVLNITIKEIKAK